MHWVLWLLLLPHGISPQAVAREGLCPCVEDAVIAGDLEAPACFAKYSNDPEVAPDRELLRRLKADPAQLKSTQEFWRRLRDGGPLFVPDKVEPPIMDPASVPKEIDFGVSEAPVTLPIPRPLPSLSPSPRPSPSIKPPEVVGKPPLL